MKGATVKPYASAREDRDYLLDYKSIDLSSLEKVDLLDVPVDNVDRDEAVACIMDMVERKDGPHFVFFADPVKLMQIRPGKKHSFIARDSAMILADGAGLPWAAQKLGTPLKERIPMIAFLMDVIRLSVKREFTIYLLGSRMEYLEKVFLNLPGASPVCELSAVRAVTSIKKEGNASKNHCVSLLRTLFLWVWDSPFKNSGHGKTFRVCPRL